MHWRGRHWMERTEAAEWDSHLICFWGGGEGAFLGLINGWGLAQLECV